MECVSFERVDVATFQSDPRDRVVVIGPWTFWQLGEHLAGLTTARARAEAVAVGGPARRLASTLPPGTPADADAEGAPEKDLFPRL